MSGITGAEFIDRVRKDAPSLVRANTIFGNLYLFLDTQVGREIANKAGFSDLEVVGIRQDLWGALQSIRFTMTLGGFSFEEMYRTAEQMDAEDQAIDRLKETSEGSTT